MRSGIAEYHAPNLPMMRDVAQPGMVKHGIGWAAMTGVTAAGLAARGYTGIPTLLALPEYQEWACDIGQDYLMVEGVAWKPARYACCGWAHAGVEGARRLVEENHIDLDEIQASWSKACHGTDALFKGLPSTTEEAQFSQSWPLAAMLVDGEIGPAQILEERLSDPAHPQPGGEGDDVVESPEMERLCELFEQGDPNGRFASTVTITLKDGRELSVRAGRWQACVSRSQAGTWPGWTRNCAGWRSLCWMKRGSMLCPDWCGILTN